MKSLESFQQAVTTIRLHQLKKIKVSNSCLRARLAYLRRFGQITIAQWREIENNLRGRVRGTPEPYTLSQRGSTPRPATKSK